MREEAAYDEVLRMMVEEQDGRSTPRRGDYRIPAASACPPPPKKKPFSFGKKREPPKDGYFQPPDLELFFSMAYRKQACSVN
ncbi:hypothetical protein SLEP1_g41474 [Rubroshorea leprosula]|uniref:Uncharacterized protein n=1 Tax=Rubroshorea leprosula TaxID=152421 RepID=A0AAV5L6M2_9ROSI|nr:hypothetical protein SLEP1_g41474 [Rubroshorea leprosula]